MPKVSEFYGIVIRMYHREHGRPHFHAIYGEHRAVFDIDSMEVVSGRLPVRARRLVFEWAAMHQDELAANWRRAGLRQPLARIEPLP